MNLPPRKRFTAPRPESTGTRIWKPTLERLYRIAERTGNDLTEELDYCVTSRERELGLSPAPKEA